MAELSNEEISEYKKAFDVFDRDGDGHITPDEFGSVMRSLGQNLSQSELQEIINEIDTSKNGTIEFSEFLAVTCQKRKDADYEREIREAFEVFDRDHTGYITAAGLRHVMISLGEDVTDEEAEEVIRRADQDGDGRVSYDDFCRLMREP